MSDFYFNVCFKYCNKQKRFSTPSGFAAPHKIGAEPCLGGTACLLCFPKAAAVRLVPLFLPEWLCVPVFRCFAEGSPVDHPGMPGTIVAIETANARRAAIARSAESQKAAKAGAKEFHLQDEFSTCGCKITTFL